MSLTLRVWKDGDRANATEHPFEQDHVGIGRDPANLLQLARPNVSKNHACIEQSEGELCLTDLKSRNGTYVNGVRIPPQEHRLLNVGDKVRVCDFIVEVVAWDTPASATVALPEGPGAQEVPGVQEVPLSQEVPLCPVSQEVTGTKEETVVPGAEDAEAQPGPERGRSIEQGEALLAAAEQECERLRLEVAALKLELAEVRETSLSVRQVDGVTGHARLNAVLEAVLQPVLRIMRGRILFRSEFMGATMFQDPKIVALSKRSPQEWIGFFLDAQVTEEEARDRLEILAYETGEVIPHVIGLLDGYRKSVDVGAKNILQQLNPIRIREELFKKPLQIGPLSIPYRFLPLIADRIAWRALEQRHRELQEEDRGILEQRFFRPGFIQGYVSTITSAKHEPLPLPPKLSTSAKAEP
jgi:hypothetical protein